MSVGTIEWYSWESGRGLIARDDGGPDISVDRDSVVSTDRILLNPGQRVTFDVLPGRSGLEAQNVRRLDTATDALLGRAA